MTDPLLQPYTVFLIDHDAIHSGDGTFGRVETVISDTPESAATVAVLKCGVGDLTVAAVLAGHHTILYSSPING